MMTLSEVTPFAISILDTDQVELPGQVYIVLAESAMYR